VEAPDTHGADRSLDMGMAGADDTDQDVEAEAPGSCPPEVRDGSGRLGEQGPNQIVRHWVRRNWRIATDSPHIDGGEGNVLEVDAIEMAPDIRQALWDRLGSEDMLWDHLDIDLHEVTLAVCIHFDLLHQLEAVLGREGDEEED
jgi:hypothetical protein